MKGQGNKEIRKHEHRNERGMWRIWLTAKARARFLRVCLYPLSFPVSLVGARPLTPSHHYTQAIVQATWRS